MQNLVTPISFDTRLEGKWSQDLLDFHRNIDICWNYFSTNSSCSLNMTKKEGRKNSQSLVGSCRAVYGTDWYCTRSHSCQVGPNQTWPRCDQDSKSFLAGQMNEQEVMSQSSWLDGWVGGIASGSQSNTPTPWDLSQPAHTLKSIQRFELRGFFEESLWGGGGLCM